MAVSYRVPWLLGADLSSGTGEALWRPPLALGRRRAPNLGRKRMRGAFARRLPDAPDSITIDSPPVREESPVPRPRIREFIEDSGKVPVAWFTPPNDGSVVHAEREIWVGPREFQFDFFWSTDVFADRWVTLNAWYKVYSPGFSATRQRVPSAWNGDEQAVEGSDFTRHSMKLTLRPKETSLGTRVWEVECGRCGNLKRALYITAKDDRLACRACHNLRYRSQERLPERKLPRAQREMSVDIERRDAFIKQLLYEGSSSRPALKRFSLEAKLGGSVKSRGSRQRFRE